MSSITPPLHVSPDGKYYWDGRRWVAVAGISTGATVGRLAGTAVALLVGLAVIAAAIGGIAWYETHRTCTVGYLGSDVQVTAEGGGAPSFCSNFIANSSGNGYAIDQPDSSGTLMCRVTIHDGTVVTVRDKGILKLYGSAECQSLAGMT